MLENTIESDFRKKRLKWTTNKLWICFCPISKYKQPGLHEPELHYFYEICVQRPMSESIKDGKRHEVLEGKSAEKSSGEIFENEQLPLYQTVLIFQILAFLDHLHLLNCFYRIV